MDKWIIIAEEIFLADVGTPGFTGYEVDKGGFKSVDIVEMYEKFPGLLDGTYKNHHIHTHHNMGAFFSGTDWSNLNDRSLVSNYFAMLIVNKAGDAVAKVAFKAIREGDKPTKLSFFNNSDGFAPLKLSEKSNSEVLVVMDCKVEFEIPEVDKNFMDRYERVMKAIKEEEDKKKASYNQYPTYPYGAPGQVKQGKFYYDEGWDGMSPLSSKKPDYNKKGVKEYFHPDTNTWENYPYRSSPVKEKRIGEMTDAEWKKHEKENEGGYTGPDKWELRHAKAMINSIVENKTWMDYTDCEAILSKTDSLIKTEESRLEAAEDFRIGLMESYQILFPGKNADKEDYYDLLSVIKDYLFPYSRIILVQEFITEVEEEMEETREEIYEDIKNASTLVY